MPDGNRVWAIAYYLFYPLAAIIVICAVWMFVVKRQQKYSAMLQARSTNQQL